MKLAYGVFRFTPATFWNFTLLEWQCAVEGYYESINGQRDEPMDRDGLERLMRENPDGPRNPA